MRKSAILLICLWSAVTFAQNARVDGVIESRTGSPAAAALVSACTQPATILAFPPYCSPLAPLCASVTDATCNASTFPIQGDGLGNYHYYISKSAGPYTVCFYGGSLAVPVLGAGCLPDQNPPGSTSGSNSFKSINAIQFADQFAAATVVPPANNPGVTNQTTGGSVAANTYACTVTYNGATSGETTAPVNSGTTSTSGATSTLFCAPNDAPAGAGTFNVYWQTGGAGSFWKGHSNVAFGVMDAQTTNPATSGTNPPITNTATGPIAGAQAALAGGPGGWFVPSTMAASGLPGEGAGLNQLNIDYRNASISLWATLPPSHGTESGSDMNSALVIDVRPPVLGTRQEVNAIDAEVILGTPTWGNVIPPPSDATALFLKGMRFGARTEPIITQSNVVFITNQNSPAEDIELDCNNASGSDATNANGIECLNIFSVGANKINRGVQIAGPGGFVNGYVQAGVVTNCVLCMQSNAGTGVQAVDGVTYGAAAIDIGAKGTAGAPSDSNVMNFDFYENGTNTRRTNSVGSTQFDDISFTSYNGNLLWTKGNGAIQVAHVLFGGNTALRTYTFSDVSGTILQTGQTSANKSQRVAGCATAASLNATCDTTVTWTNAFADANYTATCIGDVVTSGVPIVEGIDISAAKTGAAITVRTISITAAAAQFTTIDCLAVHD